MLNKLLFRNFRLLYKAGRALRSRFTGNGLMILTAAITAGVFGFDTWQTLSHQVFSLLFFIIAVALLCSFGFRNKLTARRLLPDFATAGQPVRYDLIIENPDDREQVELEVEDQLQTTFPTYAEFHALKDPMDHRRNWFDRSVGYPRLMNLIRQRRGGFIQSGGRFSLPAHGRHRYTCTLTPVHRGYLNFTSVRFLKPDPLGLVYSASEIRLRERLLVFPRHVNLGKLNLPGSRKYQPQGRVMSTSVGDSEEFLSLREYRAGDPLKKIHWKSFARLNIPVIKEYHDEYCVRQGLILDTWNRSGDSRLFEDAVSAAASFAIACIRQDTILDLMFAGEKSYRFNAGRGSLTLENILEILACVQASDEDNLEALQNMAVNVSSECSVFICILLDWDARRQSLIRALRQRGMIVLCIVITPGPALTEMDATPLLDHPQYLVQVRQTDFDRDLQSVSNRTGPP